MTSCYNNALNIVWYFFSLLCRHILWSPEIVGLGGCQTVEQGKCSLWSNYRTRKRGDWWCKTYGCDSWDGWCNLPLPLCHYWRNSGKLILFMWTLEICFLPFRKLLKISLCCFNWDCGVWWKWKIIEAYGLVHVQGNDLSTCLYPSMSQKFCLEFSVRPPKNIFPSQVNSRVGWKLFSVFWINFFFLFLLGQMLGCKTRGFSFTRALLGISADELHLCGDPAVVPLIQKILKVTGDHIEVIGFFGASFAKVFLVLVK